MKKEKICKTKNLIFVIFFTIIISLSCMINSNPVNRSNNKKSNDNKILENYEYNLLSEKGLEDAAKDKDFINSVINSEKSITVKSTSTDSIFYGDVNDDGEITIEDALMISQYYVKLIEKFPAEFNLIRNGHFHDGLEYWGYFMLMKLSQRLVMQE